MSPAAWGEFAKVLRWRKEHDGLAWTLLAAHQGRLDLVDHILDDLIPELSELDLEVFYRRSAPLATIGHPDDTPAWEIHVRIRPE